ncbi:MAG: hypothetical protein S4CHLAM6_13280 [Chlamydiae bacterium]|nr:hypothetical protein [Chlamydiota bacterium]
MKKLLLSGLALLLPLALTLFVILFVLNFLTHPFVKYFYNLILHLQPEILDYIPRKVIYYSVQIFILIGLFLVTVFIGALARIFFVNYFIKISDKIIHKLPIVNKIYKTTKDIIKSIFSPDAETFKKVVLVPFPTANKYCLGLLSGTPPKACQDTQEDELATVLLPTAPHPISGYLLLFKKKDLVEVDMTIEDAVKFTVSCGIVHPDQQSPSK